MAVFCGDGGQWNALDITDEVHMEAVDVDFKAIA